MITEQDLREAIAECEGTPKPTANTCIKLAAFYTILQYMTGKDVEGVTVSKMPQYSMAKEPTIHYTESEFSEIAEEKGIEKVFPVIDELMSTLSVVNPRMYDSVIRKLEEI